jgi:hypothetical protein
MFRVLTSIKTNTIELKQTSARPVKAALNPQTVFLVVSSGPFRNPDFIGPLQALAAK